MTSLTLWSPNNHLLLILKQAKNLICWSGQLWSGLGPGVISCFLHSDGQKWYFLEQSEKFCGEKFCFWFGEWIEGIWSVQNAPPGLKPNSGTFFKMDSKLKVLHCSIFTYRISGLPAPWCGPSATFPLNCTVKSCMQALWLMGLPHVVPVFRTSFFCKIACSLVVFAFSC